MVPSPPYIPAPHLIARSGITAEELVLIFEDFNSTLRYVSTAPELVFERVVANVSGSLKDAKEVGLHEGPLLPMRQPAHDNLAAGLEANPGPLELANQKLTRKLQEACLALEESRLENQELICQLESLNKISAAGSCKNNATTAVVKANPFIGTFKTSSVWSDPKIGGKTCKTVSFENRYKMIPGILVGLTFVDIHYKATVRLSGLASALQVNSVGINLDSWGESKLYAAACNWLEIAADDLDFQYGSYHTIGHHHRGDTPVQNRRSIVFKRAYTSTPKVLVWLNVLDMSNEACWRVKTYATDVTPSGFALHIDSWAESKLMSSMASWIAYQADRPALFGGAFSTLDRRTSGLSQLYTSAFEPFPKGVFQTPPRIFFAINSLEISHKHNMRLKVTVDNVGVDGMSWHLDTWMDTLLFSAGATYIAFA